MFQRSIRCPPVRSRFGPRCSVAGGLTAVAFSPDGGHIISGSDGTLRIWEVVSRQSRRFEGHTGFVYGVAFSPDGRHIVSGSQDKTLRLWDVASGGEITRLEDDNHFGGSTLRG
jgi:WD40 repeat protein